MRWNYDSDLRPLVTFVKKREMAEKAVASLTKKGIVLEPITLVGEKIAISWWALAWNKNLESYADYKSRIQGGRAYLKNNMVLDLKIEPGLVKSLVQGSRPKPYGVTIQIDRLQEGTWKRLLATCQNQIENMSDLASGRFPKSLAQHFTVQGAGLFPSTEEIHFQCSCPDKAEMCKHVAATLYAIGARFDQDPMLFFKLRAIDVEALLSRSIDQKLARLLENADQKTERTLSEDESLALFGM